MWFLRPAAWEMWCFHRDWPRIEVFFRWSCEWISLSSSTWKSEARMFSRSLAVLTRSWAKSRERGREWMSEWAYCKRYTPRKQSIRCQQAKVAICYSKLMFNFREDPHRDAASDQVTWLLLWTAFRIESGIICEISQKPLFILIAICFSYENVPASPSPWNPWT